MNTASLPGRSLVMFYHDAFRLLADADIPFLVGGSFAQSRYTLRDRDTKDLDIVVRRTDVDRVLRVFANADYRTALPYPHWLGKIYYNNHYLDVMFGSGNGVVQVDDGWFANSVEAEVLGKMLRLVPPEELLWSKAFVQERERFDGADVLHLLHACARDLDWDRLLGRFGNHWPVLLSHLVLFQFVYPDRRSDVPAAVIDELTRRLWQLRTNDHEHVCYGTLLSREQYLFDLETLGYKDARTEPSGGMTADETEIWTRAIDRK